jgi:hypothetical protein
VAGIQKTATAWESPAEEVVGIFYIGFSREISNLLSGRSRLRALRPPKGFDLARPDSTGFELQSVVFFYVLPPAVAVTTQSQLTKLFVLKRRLSGLFC